MKNAKSDTPLELANCILSHQRNTLPAVKAMKSGQYAMGQEKKQKRHLYEFSCYFSEVIIEQFFFPKLAQNSYLKGEQELYKLLLDSEVGVLIRVTIVLYVYLCNCSIRSVKAGTEILMSFQCHDASRLTFFFWLLLLLSFRTGFFLSDVQLYTFPFRHVEI